MTGVRGTSLYRQTIDTALSSRLGTRGLQQAAFETWLDRLDGPVADLQKDYHDGRLPVLRVPDDTADIVQAEQALARLCQGAQTLVFLGMGGSSLGGQTLAQLAGWNIPGSAPPGQRGRPRTRFYDNLDPVTLSGALGDLDLATARFVVTSKSGGTPETLAQALAALGAVRAAGLGDRLPQLFLGVTEPARAGGFNGLRTLFESFGIPVLDHHPGIGGRFSVLTNVGLLPALARGLDVRAIRAGARAVISDLLASTSARGFAPAEGAALAVALDKEQGVTMQVMMPYADRLGRLAHWFVQLWAESLGKGGNGSTPIACLGPLDQHSQLQLFMDGPRLHLITVIRAPSAGCGPVIDAGLAKTAGLDMMAGRTIGDLVEAQAQAVPEALMKAGRPVRSFDLGEISEATMGALLMHFMIETILAGRLLGIDPFDQPAVELAKVLTRDRLSGRG